MKRQLSNDALEYLAGQLSSQHWSENKDWNPLQTWPENNPRDEMSWRWQFDSQASLIIAAQSDDQEGASGPNKTNEKEHSVVGNEADGKIESTDTKSESKKDTEGIKPGKFDSPVWNGFRHLGMAHVVKVIEARETKLAFDSDDERLIAYLKTLSWRKGIVGDNAAILLARRYPKHAFATLDRLEQLVEAAIVSKPKSTFTNTKTILRGQSNDGSTQDDSPLRKWASRLGVVDDKSATSELSNQQSNIKAAWAPVSPLQLAAAEAWCSLLAMTSSNPIDGLAPVGRILVQPDVPIRLRAELYRDIAIWVAPKDVPQLELALKDLDETERVPVEIRRAAIDACLVHVAWYRERHLDSQPESLGSNSEVWPATLHQSRHDSDAHVRSSYGHWLAATNHDQALSVLKSQLLDRDVGVRQQALINMGVLQTDEAQAELISQIERGQDRVREFAIKGLGAYGLDKVTPYVDDESPRVRSAVATEVGKYPQVKAGLLLRNLLLDRSPTVQKAAVAAIADWPTSLASPVLLYGMRDGNREVRRICYRNLSKRADLDWSFNFDAGHAERVKSIQDVASRANLRLEYLEELAVATPIQSPNGSPARRREIENSIAQITQSETGSPVYLAAYQQLMDLGKHEIVIVEEFLDKIADVEQIVIRDEILPAVSDVYGWLKELRDENVEKRRKAAQNLVVHSQKKTLSETVLRIVRQQMLNEQDRIVWQHVMQAITDNHGDQSAQIALVALNHTWPDIRILGCKYVGRHGRPQHAGWLRLLLDDRNRQVQLAAMRAAGECHNPVVVEDFVDPSTGEKQRGLNALLSDSNVSVRLQAAVSLAKLGQDSGVQELLRRLSDPSPGGREQVVRLMGNTGQQRFVKHLIRIAWTENSGAVKRSILHSLDQLTLPAERPQRLEQAVDYDQKIRVWQDWNQRFNSSFGQNGSTPAELNRRI